MSDRIVALLTDGNKILYTLLVKYYNDLLEKQKSGRVRVEVTYFYVGNIFCIYLGTKYADFQEKNLRGVFWKKLLNFSL